jgi:hypothetical protein
MARQATSAFFAIFRAIPQDFSGGAIQSGRFLLKFASQDRCP